MTLTVTDWPAWSDPPDDERARSPGGTVSYSITDPAPPGDLALSSSGGLLSAGQSVTVSVTVSSSTGLASETDLTVGPDGLTVAVLYSGA